MPPSRNILEALFDVRPMTPSGRLDLEKINRVKPEINLSGRIRNITKPRAVAAREGFFHEFERTIAGPVNVEAEVVKLGGQVHVYHSKKTETSIPPLEDYWRRMEPAVEVVAETVAVSPMPGKNCYHSHGEREMEVWLDLYRKNRNSVNFKRDITPKGSVKIDRKAKKHPWTNKFKIFTILFVSAGLAFSFFGYRGGVGIKDGVLKNGGEAVSKLQAAKESLENFNFLGAADNFALAFDDFSKASDGLNNLGANFLSGFSAVPGLDKVKSASNLVKAGQNISKAGENLALAFSTLSQTNFLEKKSLAKTLGDFKNVLIFADRNISSAQKLVADIDAATLPDDKRQLFLDFKEKIPEFQKYVGEAVDYSDFLLGVVGEKSTKKYLVLMQNNSELRATGGFPGSYALVTFDKGFLKDVIVDDIYNPDGQLKENIVPPIPLQHITPNWGMRDANWFADFPTSAKKIEEFYKKDTASQFGNASLVNGVLSLTPTVIEKVLEVVGPIEMPQYNMVVDAKNFRSEIQKEVEYGANRSQPKTVLKEFQPKLFAKLAALNGNKWLEIFKIITQAAEEKQILAYFNDDELEKAALDNGLAGQVKKTGADYLQVVFSNVKGSKSDAVITNSFRLNTAINSGAVSHKLVITRSHDGGDSKLGFYNKTNPAYVRVYVPSGSNLINIRGSSLTDYRPLIGHEDFNFKTDPELAAIEAGMSHPFKGVDVFKESGKTVFGFWLVLKPKETKTVELEYVSAATAEANYDLLWQKQSGTGRDSILLTSESLITKDGKNEITSDLSVDREFHLELK